MVIGVGDMNEKASEGESVIVDVSHLGLNINIYQNTNIRMSSSSKVYKDESESRGWSQRYQVVLYSHTKLLF